MSGTILLADDSLTIQKVVELTFADTNYRVVAVSSGDELLDKLGDSQPDLIICDVIMPGKDGYEVCQQIKSSSEWLHLPVILLTGTFEPFDRDRAIAAGCSEIITKPFEARKLVDTVERLIGGPDVQTPEPDDGPAMADDEDVWPEEATPIDAPTEAEEEEFGTQLSAPEVNEEGIEFTTTGFAEMEAAGQDGTDPPAETGDDDGLEYEFGVPESPDFEDTTPSAGPPPPPADVAAHTVKIDMASVEDDAAAPDDQLQLDAPEAEVDEGYVEEERDTDSDFSAEAAPEAPAASEDEPVETPPEEEGGGETFTDEPSMADTSPVDPPSEPTDGDAAGMPLTLTEEDIDRIAHRVIELAADRIEQIAWEVVPDMAEIVVRQRIRELEAESETSAPDTVQ